MGCVAAVATQGVGIVHDDAQQGIQGGDVLKVWSAQRRHHGCSSEDLPWLASILRGIEGILQKLKLNSTEHLKAWIQASLEHITGCLLKLTPQWLLCVAADIRVVPGKTTKVSNEHVDGRVALVTPSGLLRSRSDACVKADNGGQVSPLNDLSDGEIVQNAPYAERSADGEPLYVSLCRRPRSRNVARLISFVVHGTTSPIVVHELMVIPDSNEGRAAVERL
mmetsp:Transcript_67969/g.163163  ORF Transcript_67969/g.163163 Transcript_67969/m.163163 type:complete len:222 (-) Transcript_67969:928-1593(-)